MLIDAAYAGLMTEQWDCSVVIPTRIVTVTV